MNKKIYEYENNYDSTYRELFNDCKVLLYFYKNTQNIYVNKINKYVIYSLLSFSMFFLFIMLLPLWYTVFPSLFLSFFYMTVLYKLNFYYDKNNITDMTSNLSILYIRINNLYFDYNNSFFSLFILKKHFDYLNNKNKHFHKKELKKIYHNIDKLCNFKN